MIKLFNITNNILKKNKFSIKNCNNICNKNIQYSKIISNDLLVKFNNNPVIQPITLSSTFKLNKINNNDNFTYSRSNNPTRKLLENNLALLENAQYGLAFSSGLGATTCVTHLLKSDEEILACHDLYGGTKRYFNNILQHKVNYINFKDYNLKQIEKLFINSNIKMIWIETPTNPLLEIIPFKNLGALCKKYNKLLVVDNTFMTPVFQNPLDYNADIVLHSISKYINGHSDIIMGGLMMNNKELYDKLKYLQNSLGVIPSPFDCYIVNRSIKTLYIRMKKHQHNAIYIAKKLHKHPKILKVLYPGLDKNNIPCHMKGYGAMISLYIKCSSNKINNFIEKLEVIPLAESLGGIETLICHPASMTHASIPINEKNKIGITSNLLRLSVGIEDKNYILNDILNALEHI
tara:strand:- start:727 stop:1941 length:1215 start_codon:yes stop_codon:yes gene_type:complete